MIIIDPYILSASDTAFDASLIAAAACYALALPPALYLLYDAFRHPKKDLHRGTDFGNRILPDTKNNSQNSYRL